jgi:plasmid maintenance system antidote protein VapI
MPTTPRAHDPITPGRTCSPSSCSHWASRNAGWPKPPGSPQTRISEIVRGKRSITTETALRLSRALGVDDRFWINIQSDYDIEVERDLHGAELDKVTTLVAS